MDRKSIIALVVCFIVLMAWYPLVNKIYPPKPLPPGATNAYSATLSSTNGAASPQAMPAVAEEPPPAPKPVVTVNVPEELLAVANGNARYTFTTHGGGLKLVELLQYPETVSTHRAKQPQTTNVATLNSFALAPTLALLDGEAVQGDGVFTLARIDNGVRAEKTLTNGLTIVKDFQLSTNYLVMATVRLENRSAQPLTLPAQEWVVGTASPLGPRDKGQAVGVLWYNGSKTEDLGGSSYFSGGCRQPVPPLEYRGGASNVVWVATHNQFFALAAMPQQPAEGLVIRRIALPRPTGEEAALVATNAPTPQGYAAAMIYPALTLAPNQTFERKISLYTGPKSYSTLARIADRFNNNLDLVMNFGWAGFVSKALLLGMNWLHGVLKISYGWAIIAITVIIKAVFWPLTQASTRSMKRLQALQPQMNAIKEKYKDDPVKMNKKTMEFMRENKVSPLGGCLPMLLQIPVFFGFFSMIQSAIELRGASFLWIGDLAQTDTLFVIPGLGFIPFFGIVGVGLPFNLLPLIMGATMLWQAHLTPPSPGMDPTQQKIMRYMPLMFLAFLYNYSAGLTLYWTVQNLLTILQTKLTRTTPGATAPAKVPVLTPPPKKEEIEGQWTWQLNYQLLTTNSRMPADPQTTLHKILELLGFPATVEEHRMEEGILLDVKTDDSGRLIGRQGQTLADLQYITNRILFQQDPSVPKVLVDVGGYRAQAREALVKKAKEAAEKVRRWGDVVELEPLSAFDRRIIHQALKDDPSIETHSVEVEGTDKKAILLRPKH